MKLTLDFNTGCQAYFMPILKFKIGLTTDLRLPARALNAFYLNQAHVGMFPQISFPVQLPVNILPFLKEH